MRLKNIYATGMEKRDCDFVPKNIHRRDAEKEELKFFSLSFFSVSLRLCGEYFFIFHGVREQNEHLLCIHCAIGTITFWI